MSERQHMPQPQPKGDAQVDSADSFYAVADVHRRAAFPVIRRRFWHLLGIVLLSALTLVVISREQLAGSERPLLRQGTSMQVLTAKGTFREYP